MKNDDLRVINQIYKPYKYTLKGNVKILYCVDGIFVIKNKNVNVKRVHSYLYNRGFNNYASIIDDKRSNYDVYNYIDDANIPLEQKGTDMARVVALLHAKTSYNKAVDKIIYDNIYNDINNNCDFIKDYYSKLYDDLFLIKYHKPHEIYFLDNYSKINSVILFCKDEIDKWYNMVSDNSYQRVALIHNNLSLDHYLVSDDGYLISFDNAKFETPVLDIVKLYKKVYNKINFNEFLKKYFYHFSFTEDELKLFFVLISIPDIVELENDLYLNLQKVYNLFDYINKTEELVWPYYSEDEKEE